MAVGQLGTDSGGGGDHGDAGDSEGNVKGDGDTSEATLQEHDCRAGLRSSTTAAQGKRTAVVAQIRGCGDDLGLWEVVA